MMRFTNEDGTITLVFGDKTDVSKLVRLLQGNSFDVEMRLVGKSSGSMSAPQKEGVQNLKRKTSVNAIIQRMNSDLEAGRFSTVGDPATFINDLLLEKE